MLCLSCQRQPICWLNQFSQANPKVTRLMKHLRSCELRIPIQPPSVRQVVDNP